MPIYGYSIPLITVPYNDLLSYQHAKLVEHVNANVEVHFGLVIFLHLTNTS